MDRDLLSDAQWARISELLPGKPTDNGGRAAVIAPRSNRLTPREFDRERYNAHNLIERFFNRLKQFRRLATRYDTLANRFNAFLHLACTYIWLL